MPDDAFDSFDLLGRATETFTDPEQFTEANLRHSDPYTLPFLGRRLWVYPGVFSPMYSESNRFLIRNWDLASSHEVLDMGTGTGIIAIAAALLVGAQRIVAVDINPVACECARRNVLEFGLEGVVQVLHGDLFSPITGAYRFDRILFNPPYHHTSLPRTPLEQALYDPRFQIISRFLKLARGYLKEQGRILVTYSSLADIETFEQLTRQEWRITTDIYQSHDKVGRYLYFLEPFV